MLPRHGFRCHHGARVALGAAELGPGSGGGGDEDVGAEVVVAVVSVLLSHEVAVAHSGGVVSVEWHAVHGAVEDGEADVEDPLGPARGAADLERDETRAERGAVGVRTRGRRGEVSDEDANSADVDVFEPMKRVDLNHDGGGVGAEKFVVDAEDELVVPRWVGVALGVDARGELPIGVDPRNRVGPHVPAHGSQILGRNDIEFQ